MKSAYELAMERLEKSAPTQKLTEEQKAQIAEIDSLFKSKIAERETFLNGRIEAAKLSGDHLEVDSLKTELARDLATLREDWDAKKESLRKSF